MHFSHMLERGYSTDGPSEECLGRLLMSCQYVFDLCQRLFKMHVSLMDRLGHPESTHSSVI